MIPKAVYDSLTRGLEKNKSNEMIELLTNGFSSLIKSSEFKHTSELQSFINTLFKIQCDLSIDNLPLHVFIYLYIIYYYIEFKVIIKLFIFSTNNIYHSS